MDLFTLHNCCSLCSLNYLKLEFESKSRLPIPEFSGSHCRIKNGNLGVSFNDILLNFRLCCQEIEPVIKIQIMFLT